MNKAKPFFVGMLSGTALAFALLVGRGIDLTANAADSDIYRYLNLFGDVFEQVRTEYVEKPDDLTLIQSAMDGMVNSLDPHSDYLTPEEYKETRTEVQGEFGGLGIRFEMEAGVLRIVTALEGTPAEEVGLTTNDLVTHIDGEPVDGMNSNDAVKKMRGPVGTRISLRIFRALPEPEDNKIFDVEIIRALIQDIPVFAEIQAESVGYLRIRQFNDKTMIGVRRSFRDFEKYSDNTGEELKGYVLDLRNNPGGLLDQAIEVSDAFLDGGEVLTTRGRRPEALERFAASNGDLAGQKPLIVMINGASASASEIVAGALQDMRRATVLGTRSFGKGSVQSIIPLGQNGALRLTTARYFTPSGRSIQSRGIDPDIVVQQTLPEGAREGDFDVGGEASLQGHLEGEGGARGASSAFVPSPSGEIDDVQLNYAISLITGELKNDAFPASEALDVPEG